MLTKIQHAVAVLQNSVWYSLVIAGLAILSLVLLAYEFSPWAQPDVVYITQRIDLAIAWIFLTDFFSGLAFNKQLTKKQYLKENYLNLISSIPVTEDAIRILRILRVLRAFRVIRAATNFWFAKQRFSRNHKH